MSIARFTILEYGSQAEHPLEIRKKVEICEIFFFFFRSVLAGIYVEWPVIRNPNNSGLIR